MDTRVHTASSSDETLAVAVRAGDRAAEFELDRRWRKRLVAFGWSILGDNDLAEEAAQITLWRACFNIERYDCSRPFEPWILAVARNCARDLRRRREAQAERNRSQLSENKVSSAISAMEPLATEEETGALRTCLEGLGDRSRTVVVLHMIGFSLSEVGRVLKQPKSTVQSWLQKGFEQLRRCMRDKGFT